MAEVAPEPLVPEAGADVLVARHEPAPAPLVVEDSSQLPQAVQDRVGILQKGRVRGIEDKLILYKHRLTIRLERPSYLTAEAAESRSTIASE